MKQSENRAERGTILLVVVFIATAIAGLALISSGRVVSETRFQRVMESESMAYNDAFAQIHLAINVVNTSAYDDLNHNLALRDAMEGAFGGTADLTGTAGTTQGTNRGQSKNGTTTTTTTGGHSVDGETAADWLDDPPGVVHGFIEGTDVRVYRGREYIQRLQKLKGDPVTDVDPFGDSDRYFILEAAGRSRSVVRLVSALVRETQPFSSYVFFQNRATLGVSGAPRGLIHTNEELNFYFPNGSYMDGVSAVQGFDYVAGATVANTNLRDANPAATPIKLEAVDFEELKGKADLYKGEAGLDAKIKFYKNGRVRIIPHTPPRYDMVEKTNTYQRYLGSEQVPVIEPQQVQVGTQQVAYDVQVVDHYETETYWKWQKVKVGETTETRYRDVQVQTGTETVTTTKQEPVYELQTVTRTRSVKVWQSFSTDAGGGTTVGGGADGELGEWVWIKEQYQTEEMVQVGTKTVESTKQVPVYKTVQEAYTVTTPIYKKKKVEKTRQVPVYKTVTKYKTEPVYETQDVEVTKTIHHYETVTETYTVEEFIQPKQLAHENFTLGDAGGTIYVDGRITRMKGALNGRLTIVGNEKIRINGNIQYYDDKGKKAMKNGTDYTQPYGRNVEYTGNSVLGIIARDDIIFARQIPGSGEINGTLLSATGRVGVDGFWADESGELHLDSRRNRKKYLTEEEQAVERAYDRLGHTKTKKFVKNSLRRIGGIISNDRIMETYIRTRRNGTAYVKAGFKRGTSKFDINMLHNPPPNFVEVPRPVLAYFAPVFATRADD